MRVMNIYDRGMSSNGFTLIEAVLVILILGILAAVATPKFFSNSVFTTFNSQQNLQSALSYTRNTAITTQCSTELRLTASGWEARRDEHCSPADPENCPTNHDSLNFTVALSDADGEPLNSTTALTGSPHRLVFSSDGRLYHLTALPTENQCTTLGAPVAAGTSLTLTDGSTLTLDGATAYAALQ